MLASAASAPHVARQGAGQSDADGGVHGGPQHQQRSLLCVAVAMAVTRVSDIYLALERYMGSPAFKVPEVLRCHTDVT